VRGGIGDGGIGRTCGGTVGLVVEVGSEARGTGEFIAAGVAVASGSAGVALHGEGVVPHGTDLVAEGAQYVLAGRTGETEAAVVAVGAQRRASFTGVGGIVLEVGVPALRDAGVVAREEEGLATSCGDVGVAG